MLFSENIKVNRNSIQCSNLEGLLITSGNGNYRTLSTELASSDHNLLYQHGQIPSQKPQNKRPITIGSVKNNKLFLTYDYPNDSFLNLLIDRHILYQNTQYTASS